MSINDLVAAQPARWLGLFARLLRLPRPAAR